MMELVFACIFQEYFRVPSDSDIQVFKQLHQSWQFIYQMEYLTGSEIEDLRRRYYFFCHMTAYQCKLT